jgi:D-tyrosyl-tRNA(Tyr) deacylase
VKTVVQRVTRAKVSVEGEDGPVVTGEITRGVMLLVGVEKGDSEADADATARKIAALRIFPKPSPSALSGKTPMDQTLAEVGGACLVVSQFTLCASLSKGNRPSFEPAEAPVRAEALYLRVVEALRATGLPVATGRFGADMAVELVNDGPVTFLVLTKDGTLVK